MKDILSEMIRVIEELASSVDSLELALIDRGYIAPEEANNFLIQAQLNARLHMSSLRNMISKLAE